MSEHKAMVEWRQSGPDFRKGQYSRAHAWRFDGGVEVPASASPAAVAAPWCDPTAVDPEEAYVASIASCHMLWWLALAAKEGFDVTSYRDEAVGAMTPDEGGVPWVSTVVLHPQIRYGARSAGPTDEARLHELAHARCFIANSVKTQISVAAGGPAPSGKG